MAVKIEFDNSHNVETPTFVLAKRDGERIGALPVHNLVFKDDLDYSEFSCRLSKYQNDVKYIYWEQVEDFKLVWCRSWDKWFEISVEIDETDETEKIISAVLLGKAELSQIKLYNVEINTENDIARDDYVPTVLCNNENHEGSLLHRITQKAPHYHINHVDDSISGIQRTFSFDNISIDDAFHQIEEEIECIFVIESKSDSNGNIDRSIDVYDLKSFCFDCGKRGNFLDKCPDCGSKNISEGYGDDTTIFVSSDNLAENIKYSTDVNSVKNCFKLEAGDDLMTATIKNCNPNGSEYIWYFSEKLKSDMPQDLVSALEAYDTQYQYFQNEYAVEIKASILGQYNEIIEKYQSYTQDFETMQSPIIGFHNLIKAYYDTIDLYLYLNDKLMPTASLSDTTADEQVTLLTSSSLSPVSVTDINTCSNATASSAVLSSAKIVVDSRYQVKINKSTLSDLENGTRTWTGSFIVTNYSDEEDTAKSETITIIIDDDYQTYIKQKIEKTLNKKSNDSYDIVSLFKSDSFENELKKYCLSSLKIFYDSCQAYLDILVEQGIADNETWADTTPNLYEELYLPYYKKLNTIQNEIYIRESEIATIIGKYDNNNILVSDGIQTIIERARNLIQNSLNFEKFFREYIYSKIGQDLWLKLIAYRREDTYSNENYISDGLDNAQLIENALEFIETAEKDIYKSANLQYSISASLKNLLVMKEFSPIVDCFEVGNWIRLRVDDDVYKLRLISYEIDFDNLDVLNVEFSDVTKVIDGYSDIESILNRATSISSSFSSVSRQAEQGVKSNEIIGDWIQKGLDAANTKIVNSAENQNVIWDEHGILLREQNPFDDSYSQEQTKIINKGLFITNDNWKTAKTGIGSYIYYDPVDKTYKNGYGIIADTICSNLILSKRVGIYNEDESIEIGKDGIIVTTSTDDSSEYKNIFTIQKDTGEKMAYVDSEGNLRIKGQIEATSLVLGSGVTISQNQVNGLPTALSNKVDSSTFESYKTNISDSLNSLGGQIDGKISTYSQSTEPANPKNGDLWYYTGETTSTYTNGKLYRYNGASWVLIDDKALESLVKKRITIFTGSSVPTSDYKIGDRWIYEQFEYECISTNKNSILDWILLSPIRENLLISTSSPDADNNFKRYLVNNGGHVEYRKSYSMGSAFSIKASNKERHFYTSRADVTAGSTYVFSFLAETEDSAGTVSNILDVYYGYSTKSLSELSYTSTDGTLTQSEVLVSNVTLTNKYKYVIVRVTVPTGAKSIYFRIDNNGSGSSSNEITISVTNLKLEYGNCASVYTYNKNDPAYQYGALKNGHVLMVGDNGALLGDFAPSLIISDVDSSGNRTITDGANTFKVSNSGLIVADNAVVKGTIIATNGIFTGKIYASEGEIGGWTIDKYKIYGGDGTDVKTAAIQLPRSGITWVFAAGGTTHSSYKDCPFRVDKEGNLVAEKAAISGEITATSGTIGGFTIKDDYLMYLDDDGFFIINPNGQSKDGISAYTKGYYLYLGGVSIYKSGRLTSLSLQSGAGLYSGSSSAYHGYLYVENTLKPNSIMTANGDRFPIRMYGKVLFTTLDGGGVAFNASASNIKECIGGFYFKSGLPTDTSVNSSDSNRAAIRCGYYSDSVNTPTLRIECGSSESGRVLIGKYGGTVGDGFAYVLVQNSTKANTSVGALYGTWNSSSSIGTISDITRKNSVLELSEKYSILFDKLSPIVYRYNDGTSNRFHTGFIAQSVENAIIESELTTQDFAAFCKDENGICYLRYEEFIALNTNEIQKLKKRVLELESIIAELTK